MYLSRKFNIFLRISKFLEDEGDEKKSSTAEININPSTYLARIFTIFFPDRFF